MRFLVDDQLPPALARWLVSRGHAAAHVRDLGLGGASDRMIWEEARRTGCVIVSKDDDFLNLQRQLPGPALMWITLGNCSKLVLLARMEKALPEVLTALDAGETLIEIR